MIEYQKYIGINYDELNCWGFIELIFKNEFGIIIGNYDNQVELLKKNLWIKISLGYEKKFDVIVFRNGFRRHVGMVIGNSKFIHCIENKNSCIESYLDCKWKYQIASIYRHSKLK